MRSRVETPRHDRVPYREGLLMTSPQSGARRIRHEARDGLSVAALSLVASVGVTAALWALLRWLG
jgi:hypothetical protein